MTPLEAIRKRPGMYIGGTGGSGITHLVLEVVANAYDQYLARRCSKISVDVAADGTITVTDNGPGIPLLGGYGLPPLVDILEKFSDLPTVDGHRPHVHLGWGGLGLFVVNALSERLELTTICDKKKVTAMCAQGKVVKKSRAMATKLPSGTTVRFRPDPTIFQHVRPSRVELTQHFEALSFLAPNLTLDWSFAGDTLARAGLAGHVAWRARCPVDDVATHHALYETPEGPVDVEVALAWREPEWRDPPIYSYVNLGRTIHDGTHVQGLIDGIHAYVGGRRSDVDPEKLVATVAVMLSDVIYGEPTKDRLDSPQVRKPVAEATKAALIAWERGHKKQAAALKANRN